MTRACGLINACSSNEEVAQVLTQQARELVAARMAATRLAATACAEAVEASSPPAADAALLHTADGPGGRSALQLAAWGSPGWLALPLTSRTGARLGVLQLAQPHKGTFTARDEAAPTQLAGLACACLENIELRALQQGSDRRNRDFIALLSHELRNPLAPIRNSVELLRHSACLGPAERRARDIMARQITHLVHLMDDLLDVSRIDRGKVDLRRATHTLQEVIEHAIEGCRPVIEAGGHRLELDPPAEPISVDGDLDRLSQALGNLLRNAAKFTPTGGRIQVRASIEGAHALICVTDNGIGMDKSQLSEAFDLFTQAQSRSRAQGGLGVGLALARELVTLHGGTLTAHSDGAGQGSCFTVRLPLSGVAT